MKYTCSLINQPWEDPGVLVHLNDTHEYWLFDCGDLSRLSVGILMDTTKVFVTHSHIDHFIGFDTIMRMNLRESKNLCFYGPVGLASQIGSRLQGHPDCKLLPGVEVSTGSLGHGLGIGTGMALGAKMDGETWRTWVVLGDGECDEGSVWEAALQAAQFGLDRLCAIVDYNHMQSLFTVEETLKLEPFEQKWKDFGWNAESVDGHDVRALRAACERAKDNAGSGKPSVILAHTVKGKGVSFMENDILWHYRTPQGEEYEAALKELEAHRP